jgi:hypothetical protein
MTNQFVTWKFCYITVSKIALNSYNVFEFGKTREPLALRMLSY